mgnify:CR=1 FL=1
MATAAFVGRGAQLYYGDIATPTNFIKVPQTVSIGEIGTESGDVDASDLDSVEAESVADLPTPGDISFESNYKAADPAHIQLRKDAVAGTQRYFKCEWKKAGVVVESAIFFGNVKKWGLGPTSNRDIVKLPFVIKRSGGITWLNN